MVLLMHGFIGSGKTTLARRLARERDALRLTPDEWMCSLFGDDPPAASFQERLAGLRERLREIWAHVARRGGDVILDYGFWSRSEREAILDDLRRLGLEWCWVVVDTPLEECRRRNASRNASGERSLNITEATFDLLARRFEPMDPAEVGPGP